MRDFHVLAKRFATGFRPAPEWRRVRGHL